MRIVAAAGGPLWFQLYVQPDREFTRALVERVQAAGVRALVLTVDTPVLGARNRETRIGFKLPDGMTRENLTGLDARVASATHRPPEGQIYPVLLRLNLAELYRMQNDEANAKQQMAIAEQLQWAPTNGRVQLPEALAKQLPRPDQLVALNMEVMTASRPQWTERWNREIAR